MNVSEPSGDVTVRISVDELKELIERADRECYTIFRSEDEDDGQFRWVRIIPYFEAEESHE